MYTYIVVKLRINCLPSDIVDDSIPNVVVVGIPINKNI